jgi:hypothetical protein
MKQVFRQVVHVPVAVYAMIVSIFRKARSPASVTSPLIWTMKANLVDLHALIHFVRTFRFTVGNKAELLFLLSNVSNKVLHRQITDFRKGTVNVGNDASCAFSTRLYFF